MACDRCRVRKKRCDATKPICNECQRLDFKCTWTGQAAVANEPIKLRIESPATNANPVELVLTRVLPSRDVSRHSKVFQDQTQLTLTLSYPRLFKKSISSWYAKSDDELSTMMQLALQNADISNAISVLSGHMLDTTAGTRSFALAYHQNYHTAILKIRNEMARGTTDRDKIRLYLAIVFLGFYEVCFLGNAVNASYHFIVGLHMFPQVLTASRADPKTLKLLRLTCEGHLFNLSSTALFLPFTQLRKAVRNIDWDSIISMFVPPLLQEPIGCHLSPHHGIHFEVYRLILEISLASRTVTKTDSISTKAWEQKILRLEEGQVGYYSQVSWQACRFGLSASNLYLCAIRIWIEKLKDPSIRSSNVRVKPLVEHAKALFAQCAAYKNPGFNLFWPALIFMLAAHGNDDLNAVVEYIKVFWTSPGFSSYWQRVTKMLEARRKFKPCDGISDHCPGSHDGLDLLFLPEGLLQEPSIREG